MSWRAIHTHHRTGNEETVNLDECLWSSIAKEQLDTKDEYTQEQWQHFVNEYFFHFLLDAREIAEKLWLHYTSKEVSA